MRRELIAAGAFALGLIVGAAGASRAQVTSPIATPAPTPTPSPLSSTQTFSCSCSSPGQPVQWAGRLTASNYYQASQAAIGACLGYLDVKAGCGSGRTANQQLHQPGGGTGGDYDRDVRELRVQLSAAAHGEWPSGMCSTLESSRYSRLPS